MESVITPSSATMKLGEVKKFAFNYYATSKEYLDRLTWSDENGKILADETYAPNFPWSYDYTAVGPGGELVRLFVEGTTNLGNKSKVGARINVILPDISPKPTIAINTTTPTIRVGDDVPIIAEVSGAPSGSVISYVWKVDGVVDAGEIDDVFDYRGRQEGTFVVSCEATISKTDFNPVTVTANTSIKVDPALITLVTIDTPKSIYHVGERCTFTAHPANLPEGAKVVYEWFKNTVPVNSGVSHTYSFVIDQKGEFDYYCTMTYIVGSVSKTVQSNDVDIHVVNADQSGITVGLLVDTIDGVVNVPLPLKVATLGATPDTSITYDWYIDGILDPSISGPTYDFLRPNMGVYTIFVDVKFERENYNPLTIKTSTVELQLRDYILAGVILSPQNSEVEIGEPLKIRAIVDEVPETTEVKFTWSSNGSRDFVQVTNEYEVDTGTPGVQDISVTVEMTNFNYLPTTKTSKTNATVKPAFVPDDDEEFPYYVHSLPSRQSAYIWCGWWIMYEIQDLTNEGKNWKTDESGKYWPHRKTLAMMLNQFPEVDVQESRNGYIIHRTALEAGIIY